VTVAVSLLIVTLVAVDLARESVLLAGFISGAPAAELAFVNEFRPTLRAEVSDNWPKLMCHLDDLQQEALVRLIELRQSGEPLSPPLAALAKRLIDTLARKLTRERRRSSAEAPEVPVAPMQEVVFETRRLLRLACSLPEDQASVLMKHAAYAAGEGPALDVALGVTEKVARERLRRAQAAVARLALGEESEGADGADAA
jgi:DNA-directed RNA polymerase specialized sigma24 family protein